jgi:predicted O-methyltransferase YrrM
MAGGSTSDVWGRTSDIDESALAVMAARLENRAKHPFFRGAIADYIGALELPSISRVIEIGCGTGVVSRRLAAAPGFRGTIVATDMSPYLIEIARQLAKAEGVAERITFEVSSATNLRARDSDAISSSLIRCSATRPSLWRSWRRAHASCVQMDGF